jgi:crotonobetainyl-CoA:carnitine CoA-transferase CaiB-like acyl-CoA transferase
MTDGSTALLPVASAGGLNLLGGRFACYHVYPAAANTLVAVGALEPKFWSNLCRELGREELIAQQYVEDQAPVIQAIESALATAPAEEWFARLGAKDCCLTPVRSAAHGAPQTPKLSETPRSALARAPRLGEHNEELL